LIWVEILKTLDIPESWIQIIQGEGKTVGQFLMDHPGISHLSVSASYQTIRNLAKNVSFLDKKYQFYSSGKNSIILLPGFSFQDNLAQIAKLLVLSADGSPMSIAKIFITEAIEKEFKTLLVKELENISPAYFSKLQTAKIQQLQTVGASLVAEGANKLFQRESFLLLADLSNCSEWHQEASDLPIVNITTVKYQHEIPKWINNTPFGHSILVFGEPDKAERFSKKVEARNIFINPKEINNGFYYGLKQSSFGEVGFELPNSFFSFSKKIIS
jgi:acyl-CoA reductase-like NAD-dependent aldehyde dehydrogenase